MERNRMEAFSDGVLAIVITISVLGIRLPSGTELKDLVSLIPNILIYALSFLYVGAYWNNHHHTLQTVQYVNGRILWANLFFLFWISLIPFMTNWMNKDLNQWVPTLGYGIVLLMTAIGFSLLQFSIIHSGTDCNVLKKSIEEDRRKGVITGIMYLTALIITPFSLHVSQIIYLLLLLLWFIPNRKISKNIQKMNPPEQ